jgi:SAM-dependent methyltransferase
MRRYRRAVQVFREFGPRRFAGALVDRALLAVGSSSAREAAFFAHQTRIDKAYDDAVGVSTGGVSRLFDLSITSPNARYGHSYIASDPAAFKQALRHLDVDLAACHFVDLGSGKGRALLLARDAGFAQAVGVEFAAELHESALRNVASLPEAARARIALVHGDAATYDFPEVPLVVFLYNPFGQEVMQVVAERLRASHARWPRPIRVIYVNPLYGQVWTDQGWRIVFADSNFMMLAIDREE